MKNPLGVVLNESNHTLDGRGDDDDQGQGLSIMGMAYSSTGYGVSHHCITTCNIM